jgi:hypothetical protein
MRVNNRSTPAVQALIGRFWQHFRFDWVRYPLGLVLGLVFEPAMVPSRAAPIFTASKSSSNSFSDLHFSNPQGSTSGALSTGPDCRGHQPDEEASMANVYRFEQLTFQAPATPAERSDLPEHLRYRVAADQPRGRAGEADGDVGYPLITILQPTSRIFDERHPHHIAGAVPGDILLRLPSPNSIRSGEKGIDVIVAYRDRVFKEWPPDHSRVLEVHLELPAYRADQAGLLWRHENALIQTQRLFVLYENRPFELSFTHSEIKFFRDLISHFSSHVDENGRSAPSYVRRYRFSTTRDENRLKPWFRFTFTDLGWVSGAEYDRARQLSEELDTTMKQRRKALLVDGLGTSSL